MRPVVCCLCVSIWYSAPTHRPFLEQCFSYLSTVCPRPPQCANLLFLHCSIATVHALRRRDYSRVEWWTKVSRKRVKCVITWVGWKGYHLGYVWCLAPTSGKFVDAFRIGTSVLNFFTFSVQWRRWSSAFVQRKLVGGVFRKLIFPS